MYIMKRAATLFSGIICLLCLLCACGEPHFMTDAAYRSRVERDFRQKKALMPKGDLFAIFDTSLTAYEREALEFLYAYMPLADITDYPGEFHLMNVRASRRAAREMPWGKTVPEDVFRHFVLPVRVNNEHLDSARIVFYEELKDRVKALSLQDAILEVNHWCHEKAVYMPSDARTSSPLATVRTAYGRCGEESTLLVAALRSVGIPARQVYTPRWAHTDDNHAWVEAWADGKWHFLGACEPEPVLNLGWFNAPASRGMLMHTKVFGRYEGTEEVMSVTPNYTEINVIDNYAPTAEASVTVVGTDGMPVDNACVEFKLYNYAEFYTVATKYTSAAGTCRLTAGKGDMLVWASKDGRFGFAKLSFGKQPELTVKLDKKEGDAFAVDIDIVPPPETACLPEVTPEQRAANDRRLAQEDSVRNAYTATFMTEETAAHFVRSLSGSLEAYETEQAVKYLVASRGNHAVMREFLEHAAATGKVELALSLLEQLSEKDLRDVSREVLDDHFRNTPADIPSSYYCSALLNPRIATEELTAYKSFFRSVLDAETAEAFRLHPQKLVEWCTKHIVPNDSLNSQRIPMSPQGVWKSGIADRRSRDIFFVAMARSVGIPAWIDEVTGKVRYQDLANHPELKEGATYDVDFESEAAEVLPPLGRVGATYRPTAVVENPKYYTHFTLSKFDNGTLRLQNYNEKNTTWENLLKVGRRMPAGYYVLVTGTRLASGGVLARITSLNAVADKYAETQLVLRESEDEIQVIGNFDSESLFTPCSAEAGADALPAQSLLKACGRGYFVVGILGVGQEPTNHALRDIAALKTELEKWGRKIVLLFPDEARYRSFRPEEFPGLPSTVIYGIDTDGISARIAEGMELKHKGTLPVFIIADTFNRVVFLSQGYTIGLGEQLLRTIKGI